MRISTSQIFSQSLRQMNSALSDVSTLNQMTSSQKRINSPSDDPSDMGLIVSLRGYNQGLTDYIETCSRASDYLDLADQALSQASENITAAMELAEQGATETYTTTQLQMMALEMESYRDSLMTIANTQTGADSLFAGDDIAGDAYEIGLGATVPDDLLSAAGSLVLSGETDGTIRVEFTSDGEIGTDEVSYRYSTDDGETWTEGTVGVGLNTLDLGTVQAEVPMGTTVTAAGDDGEGSRFYVREAVQYVGSDAAMSVNIAAGTEADMTSVGSSIFGGVDADTGLAYDSPNLFETISDCIVYMELGDYDGVAACLDKLTAAHENLETGAADIGARETRIDAVSQSQSLTKAINTSSISNREDADAAQLVVELEQANYVYQAVLSSSADIMKMSLLSYI